MRKILTEAATPAVASALAALPDVDSLAAALWGAAQTAWPRLGLTPTSFLAYVAQRLSLDDVAGLSSLRAEDLALASRCVAGDSAALAAFLERYQGVLEKTVRSVRTLHQQDDVVQVVLTRLLVAQPDKPPKLSLYAGRGALAGWLRVVALREALATAQKAAPEELTDIDFDLVASGADDDEEFRMIRRRYAPAFRRAFTRALQSLTARERNLLRYSLVRELSIDEIGALYGVHRATAARWVQRARATLVQGTRAELGTELGVSRERLDSLMRAIEGHVDLSLGRTIGVTADEDD